MASFSLSQPKKKAKNEGALIVYEDEASFRQTPTIHRTWARLNSQPKIPTEGQRQCQKVFGAVALSGQFTYRLQDTYFNTDTYVAFLEDVVLPKFYRRNHRIFYIQDNASYHKAENTFAWFTKNRSRIEVFNLPQYFPDLNAAERIWNHTRKHTTHNRYFKTKKELHDALQITFDDIQKDPKIISGLLAPFF